MRKSRKVLLGLALSCILSLGSLVVSYAGEWIYDGPENWQWWYQNDDGGYTKNDWQQIDGKWYHFDETGYLDMGWHQIPTEHTDVYGDLTETYVLDEWYYFSPETGEMVTSGSWEGGYISDDGILHIDEVYAKDGRTYYYGRTGSYEGSLGWKADMLSKWDEKLSDYGVYGSFSMDYQLPSNWSDECPLPLISAGVDYVCFDHWGGAGANWNYNWRVDDNNVIHIEATYYEYEQ